MYPGLSAGVQAQRDLSNLLPHSTATPAYALPSETKQMQIYVWAGLNSAY